MYLFVNQYGMAKYGELQTKRLMSYKLSDW